LYSDRTVHHFGKLAPRQEALLAAFEAAGWPPYLDAALLGASRLRTKKQLHDTVKNLSRSVSPILRFHQEGSGSRICWQAM
jgi:hypothetical protein